MRQNGATKNGGNIEKKAKAGKFSLQDWERLNHVVKNIKFYLPCHLLLSFQAVFLARYHRVPRLPWWLERWTSPELVNSLSSQKYLSNCSLRVFVILFLSHPATADNDSKGTNSKIRFKLLLDIFNTWYFLPYVVKLTATLTKRWVKDKQTSKLLQSVKTKLGQRKTEAAWNLMGL